jgi:hypothetical protein
MNLGASLASLEPIVVKMRMRIADPDAALKFLLGTIAERRACH